MTAAKPIIFGNHASSVENILKEFEIDASRLAPFDVLVWYYDYQSYDGDSYLLLRHKETGLLYSVEAGHCSCHGLEGQFEPSRTSATVELARCDKADKMPFATGDSYHRPEPSDIEAVAKFKKLLTRLAKKESIES